jgi:FkbM family methyltransferase
MLINELVKSIFYKLGFDLKRLSVNSNTSYQLLKCLEHFNIELVLDIGANRGQFASELVSFGYKGWIVSFEPLSLPHQKLCAAASANRKWTVHERCAIGDINGEIDINVSGNSVSSSILPILNAHVSASADSIFIGLERVPIFRLDTLAPSYLQNSNRFFIKIDTQGFEWQVLDGGPEALSEASGVLCELSLTQLYENQHLWLELIQRLESLGFTLWSIQDGFTDPSTGRTLQVDAVFFRL